MSFAAFLLILLSWISRYSSDTFVCRLSAMMLQKSSVILLLAISSFFNFVFSLSRVNIVKAVLNNKLISCIYSSSIIDIFEDSIVGKSSFVCPMVLLWLIYNAFTLQVVTILEMQSSKDEVISFLDKARISMIMHDDFNIWCNIRIPISRIKQAPKSSLFHCLMEL